MRFLSCFLLFSICLSVSAETYMIDVQYDTYTIPDSGQANGELVEFWAGKRPGCGHDENAMIQFDLSSYMGSNVESAIVHINRFFGCSSNVTNTDFYHATESWDETYSGSHIPHGSEPWANEIFNSNGWWAIDITSLVQAWLDGDIQNYGLVLEPRTGSGTSKFHSKDATNAEVRPYLELMLGGSQPTPTPTPETSPTPTTTPPTATPSGVPDETSVKINMPSDHFRPGSNCSCAVTVFNQENHTIDNAPLCVLLEVYGNYYFAPSFNQTFDVYSDSFEVGSTEISILPEFVWPDGCGQADQIRWMAALLNQDLTALVSDIDIFTFGWSD